MKSHATKLIETCADLLVKGGSVRTECANGRMHITICAENGRGVGVIHNRGVPGWHGTTSEEEPWQVVSDVKALWYEHYSVDACLAAINAAEGDEDAKGMAAMAILGNNLADKAREKAQVEYEERMERDEAEGIKPLDVGMVEHKGFSTIKGEPQLFIKPLEV